ncbi:MAG: hypothetical protein FVQ83_04800 [Chloroflexi bacterium]|nr:hypothetical protein [Chloroflexota bacterium]
MQILGIFFGAILALTAVNAMFLTIGALFSNPVERTRMVIENPQGRTFLLGVVNTLFFIAVIIGMFALGNALGSPLGIIPILIALVALVWLIVGTSFGLTSLVNVLGERLYSERPQLQKVFLGGSTLVLAALVPYLGWILLVSYAIMFSFGAFMSGTFRQRRLNKANEAD